MVVGGCTARAGQQKQSTEDHTRVHQITLHYTTLEGRVLRISKFDQKDTYTFVNFRNYAKCCIITPERGGLYDQDM